MKVIVRVSALLNPTEVREKVEKAIGNFIPVVLDIEDSGIPGLSGEGGLESLRKLHRSLRAEKILDTARHVLLEGITGNTTRFILNKQVAFIGKLNFPAGEESLGSIHVDIIAENEDDLRKVIDWLAPRTIDGKPVTGIDL